MRRIVNRMEHPQLSQSHHSSAVKTALNMLQQEAHCGNGCWVDANVFNILLYSMCIITVVLVWFVAPCSSLSRGIEEQSP
jgi:hypothetical protein